MKRSAEDDGVDDDLEEPDGKRLRLEISEGTDGQHIIQQVQEIQVHTNWPLIRFIQSKYYDLIFVPISTQSCTYKNNAFC